MPDPFAEYEFEEEDKVQEKVQSLILSFKKNKKKLFFGAIILFIAIIAYIVFFSGITEITITIKDTEGNPVPSNSVEVTSQNSEEIVFLASGRSRYTFSKKAGAYHIKVIASNFKVFNETKNISGNKFSETITLEKDMDLTIKNIEFPELLYTGQEAEAVIEIENNSEGLATTGFVFDNPKKVEITSQNPEISISGKSKRSFRFKIRIPESTELKDEKKGDLIKDRVRLKFLKENTFFSYKVLPFPKLNFRSNVSFSLNPGETKKQSISVTNSSRFPVEGLKMSLEIVSTQANDPEEVKNWFEFTRGNNFSTFAPGKSQELTLLVTVPIEAKKDIISGAIIYSAPFMVEPVKKELTLTIRKEVKTSISFNVPSLVSVSFDKRKNEFKKINRTLTISNNGDLDLENLTLAVRNPAECTAEWFKFLRADRVTYPVFQKRERKSELVEISAPLSARDNPEPVICKIGYYYFHPITKNSVEEVKILKITPQT